MYSKKIYTSFTNRKPMSWDETRYLREEGRDGASSPLSARLHSASLGVREWLPWRSVEMEDHLQGVRRVGASRPGQKVVGDALQAPRGVQQEQEVGKDTWDRTGVEGVRTASGSAACFVPEVSSAGTAGGEKPIKLTPCLGSTPRVDVWLRRRLGGKCPWAWPPERPRDRRVHTWEPCPCGRACPLDFFMPTVFTSLNSDKQSS